MFSRLVTPGMLIVPSCTEISPYPFAAVCKLVKSGKSVSLGQKYYHFLHHRFFECNYGGDGLVPLDKWFGSFHDGTDEAHAVIRARQKKAHGTA